MMIIIIIIIRITVIIYVCEAEATNSLGCWTPRQMPTSSQLGVVLRHALVELFLLQQPRKKKVKLYDSYEN